MPGSRPGSVALIWSQFRSTSPAVSASTSPNTCGWRRISFWRQCSATSASDPAPRSSSSSDRKWTWNSTSPSSSSSLASSPVLAAAASSYASSTVCGTIERSSCSRSHGHSRRSRRVNASRRRSASTDSADGSSAKLLRRLGGRRGRRRSRLRAVLAVGCGVAALALGLRAPALAEVGHEGVERLLLVLRDERLLDRRLGVGHRLRLGLVDLRDPEDVVAELRLDGPHELVLRRRERGRVERLLQRPL